MLTTIRTIAPLLASTVLLLMGVGLLHSVVALHGGALGFSVTMIGVLTSAYYSGFLAGTWAVPRLVHRIGHIRGFAFCTALLTLVTLLQAVLPWSAVWLVARVLQGMLLVGLYAIIESWLNSSADRQQRSSVFAVYMMLNLGASAVAQQFLQMPVPGIVLFCTVAVLFSAAGLPVIATPQRQPVMRSMPRVQVVRLFRLAPTALATSLISGLMLGALWGLLPLYAQANGFSLAQIGTFMTAAIAGGMLMQWPLGRFSDRIDRRLALAVISAAAALLALGNVLLPGGHYSASLALVFAFGGMSFALYPIAVAHLVDYLEPGDLLSASSTVLLVNGIGSALGPLVAGALMSRWNPLLFVWFAALSGLLTVYALLRYARRHRQVTATDHFTPRVQTSAGALEGDGGEHASST